MTRTGFGARRRTATPADRHKRAVAYRHKPVVQKKKVIEAISPVADIPVQEEIRIEDEMVMDEAGSELDTAAADAAASAGFASFFGKVRGLLKKNAEKEPEAAKEVKEEPSVKEEPAEEVKEEPAAAEVKEDAAQDEMPVEAAEPAITEEPAEEAKEGQEESEPVTAAEPAVEAPAKVEETAAEEEPEEKKGLFRSISDGHKARKAEKKAQLDWEADLPKNGLFTMLLFPGTAIDRENREEGAVMGSFAAFLMNIIKWLVIASALVYPIYAYIQEKSFSIVSMNFTGAAVLAMKLALFGFVAEYVVLGVLGLIGNLTGRAIQKHKLTSSVGRGSLGIAVAFAAAGAVMFFKGFAFGFAALTASVFYSVSLFAYGVDRCMKMNKTLQMILMSLLVFGFALAGYKYIAFIAPDVLKVLQYIVNL